MPDFDIDFCQGNRDRVIDYVKDKYGRDAVSQIATFGTMAAKARSATWAACWAWATAMSTASQADPGAAGQDGHAGAVPGEAGWRRHLRARGARIEQRARDDEEVAELLALATRVEGIVRNIGMHAGGVLIAPGKITDFARCTSSPAATAR